MPRTVLQVRETVQEAADTAHDLTQAQATTTDDQMEEKRIILYCEFAASILLLFNLMFICFAIPTIIFYYKQCELELPDVKNVTTLNASSIVSKDYWKYDVYCIFQFKILFFPPIFDSNQSSLIYYDARNDMYFTGCKFEFTTCVRTLLACSYLILLFNIISSMVIFIYGIIGIAFILVLFCWLIDVIYQRWQTISSIEESETTTEQVESV